MCEKEARSLATYAWFARQGSKSWDVGRGERSLNGGGGDGDDFMHGLGIKG